MAGTGRGAAAEGAAAAAGAVLAAVIRAIGTVRGPRPIHTTGLVLTGSMRWAPRTGVRAGIAWIDERGDAEVAVRARLSRGAALPAVLPDVIGLALRIGAGEGDLLLSSTGIGVPGRFLLLPRRAPAGVMSTLMPYRGDDGPVVLAARSRTPAVLPRRFEDVHDRLLLEPWRLDLLFASPTSRWHRFATLQLRSTRARLDSPDPRFDPVLAPPAGAGAYAWARLLRERAYAAGRASRLSR